MSLLPTRKKLISTSQSVPPGWESSEDDLDSSLNLAAFLTATNRMKKYDSEDIEPVKQLSHGSTFRAEVCRDTETGSLVVVKKLLAEEPPSQPQSIPTSVVQEMLISVWPPFLGHPNITQTLGFQRYTAQGNIPTITLVLEYSELGSLGDYLKGDYSSLTNSWEQKRALSLDIASGLERLHRCRVIHGDLKPDNILLFERKIEGLHCPLMAKLVDFGNAIIDDKYSKNFRETKLSPAYYGTPLWIPPKVVDMYGQSEFEDMAVCDVFSFGLVLWSIYKECIFYDGRWKEPGQTDEAFLEEARISQFKAHFDNFVAQARKEMPIREVEALTAAFYKSIGTAERREQVVDGSLPDWTEDTACSPLSLITDVKHILTRDSPFAHNLGFFIQQPLWLPFDMGQAHLNVNDNVPWSLQSKYYHDLLHDVHDPNISEYKRGAKAMELAACSSLGFGCKKSTEDVLKHLHMANSLNDFVAQLTVTRLFDVHQKSPPVPGNADSVDIANEDADNEWVEVDLGEGKPKDKFVQLSGLLRSRDSPSNTGNDHALFHLSQLVLLEFQKSGLPLSQYYCWHVRTTKKLLSSIEADSSFTIQDEVIDGMDDPRLLQVMHAIWSASESISPQAHVDDDPDDPILHRAVITQRTDVLAQLLGLGMDPNSTDDEGRTLLQTACQWGNRTAVDLLLDHGARADIPARGGDLPLHWLWMFEEDIEVVCSLLVDRGGADVNATMNRHDLFNESWSFLRIFGTALHAAVAARSLVAIRVLLDHGADVNRRPYPEMATPAELAAKLHLPEILEFLASRGAKLGNEVDGGWVLHSVAEHVNPLQRWMIHGAATEEAVEQVIRVSLGLAGTQGLSIDAEDNEGLRAIDVALCEHGEDAYIVRAFLKCGFSLDVDSLDIAICSCLFDEENASKVRIVLHNSVPEGLDGISALNLAIENGALAAVRALVEQFGSPILSCRNDRLETPMHWAVTSGILSMVKYLISENAPSSELDADGIPPIGRALLLQHDEISSLLLTAGLDLIIPSGPYKGSSVLSFAISGRSSKSISMLGFLLSGDLDKDKPARFPLLHDRTVLDARNERSGNTLLHDAAGSADYDAVFSLLRAGARCDTRNNAGRAPKDEAENAMIFSSGSRLSDLRRVVRQFESN